MISLNSYTETANEKVERTQNSYLRKAVCKINLGYNAIHMVLEAESIDTHEVYFQMNQDSLWVVTSANFNKRSLVFESPRCHSLFKILAG